MSSSFSIGDKVRIIRPVAGKEHLVDKAGKIVGEGGLPHATGGNDMSRKNPSFMISFWVVRLDGTGEDVTFPEDVLKIIY